MCYDHRSMPKTLKEYINLVVVIGVINCINSNNMNIGKLDILVILCLLIQDHGLYFHL